MKVVELKQVGKKYRLSRERKMLSRAILFGWLNRARERTLWALKNVDLDVHKGEVIGVIGENGSGKTTLLKILSGVTVPSEGQIKINGSLSSLLELGAGFHPDLTGRENIYLNASILGIPKKDIDRKFNEIVSFSGLEEFIDVPIRSYSSGMYLRLGFSVATSISSDILLIDEVLSVGDESFQKECVKKIKEFRDSGKTIIFVSHNLDMVLDLCDKVFLLSHGEIVKSGRAAEVVEFYLDMAGKKGIAVIQKGPLDVIFSQGKFSIYWNGRKITKGPGGFSSIFSSGKWHDSTQAAWEIKSKGADKLVVRGEWAGINAAQTWELDVSGQKSILWKVSTDSKKEGQLEQVRMDLLFSESYREWCVDGKKNEFPIIQPSSSLWQELLVEKPILQTIGLLQSQDKSISYPSILFNLKEESDSGLSVLNSDHKTGARVLQCLRSDKASEIEIKFDLPEIDRFLVKKAEEKINSDVCAKKDLKCVHDEGKLRFFWKNKELSVESEAAKKHIEQRTLENGLLKLICLDGTMRLFFGGRELTKGLGLHSSIYHKKNWHLSSQIEWRVEKSADMVMLRGESGYLPLGQVWKVRMPSDRIIEMDFDVVVKEKIGIEQGSMSLMLSDSYKKWFTRKHSGNFNDFFGKEWVDILDIDSDSSYGGVTKEADEPILPEVILKFASKKENNFIRISNTDFSRSARVLQLLRFELPDNAQFEPGEYPYLSFSICLKS